MDPDVLTRMRDVMTHRGPDDQDIWVEGPVGLAHRRLAIIDLSEAGRQPMANADGSALIVFNGEIYNYLELAASLRSRGREFRTGTDTEVILHLYEEMGDDCLSELNGMFAFVIWDRKRRRLFGARDRLGIKPFHYAEGDGVFACASEIKALFQHEGVRARPDERGLADFLFCGSPQSDRTVFQGVKSLLPGHSLVYEDGELTVREYWNVKYDYDFGRKHADLVGDVRDLLADAVMIHCRSDAPLGCHLSGGLDSSTVVALAHPHRDPLQSFSIRFADGGFFDESSWARKVAAHVGTEQVEERPDGDDLAQLVTALVWHLDMPIPGAAGFSYFCASRLAARHVTVSLTGHGGDEVFAGYPAQFQAAFGRTDMFGGEGRPAEPPVPMSTRLARMVAREGVGGVVRRIKARIGSSEPSLADLWIALHCNLQPDRNPVLHENFIRSLGGYSPADQYRAEFDSAPTDRPLDRVMHHDLRYYLPELLHKEDRTSMAVSLESRVPLLDYRIVELLATVPPEQKVPGLVPKALLRDAIRDRLPADVVDRRDKSPFPVPYGDWLKSELRPLVDGVVRSERSLDRGIFDPDELRREEQGSDALMTMTVVELWARLFIDQDLEILDFPPLKKGVPAAGTVAAAARSI